MPDAVERTLTPLEIGKEIEAGLMQLQVGRFPRLWPDETPEPKHLTVDQLLIWLLRERGKGLSGTAQVKMRFDSGYGSETVMSVSKLDKAVSLWSECSVLELTKEKPHVQKKDDFTGP